MVCGDIFTRSDISQEGSADGRFGLAKIVRDKDFRVTSAEKARLGRAFSAAKKLPEITKSFTGQSILLHNQPARTNRQGVFG